MTINQKILGKVLIVEDDINTRELVQKYLEKDGHTVTTSGNGTDALDILTNTTFDIIILDLMLPEINGLEICKIIRTKTNIPIVMVTALVDEEDRLTGLEMGADDYITKPFSPRELAARVKAILRRTFGENLKSVDHEFQLKFGDLVLDLQQNIVLYGKSKVELTPTEVRILKLLIDNPQKIFTRDYLINQAFGYDFDGFDRTVDTHVANLRRKLEKLNPKTNIIKTVWGVGYRMNNNE
jgi:DNA-binding response OmpR family regulator